MKLKINWNKVLEYCKFRLVEEFVRRSPVHDGALRNSIRGKVSNGSLEFYMLEYAIYIEFGTTPHKVPIDALKKWCRDKLGDENLAFAVSKSISKFGTKPFPFIRETLAQEFSSILAEALKQDDIFTIDQK